MDGEWRSSRAASSRSRRLRHHVLTIGHSLIEDASRAGDTRLWCSGGLRRRRTACAGSAASFINHTPHTEHRRPPSALGAGVPHTHTQRQSQFWRSLTHLRDGQGGRDSSRWSSSRRARCRRGEVWIALVRVVQRTSRSVTASTITSSHVTWLACATSLDARTPAVSTSPCCRRRRARSLSTGSPVSWRRARRRV